MLSSLLLSCAEPVRRLCARCAAADPGAKLGVETFMDIIETTGDSTPLNVMVRELGYRLTPVD